MISKGEALKRLSKSIDYASEYDYKSIVANIPKIEKLIYDIFNSICSCHECKYYLASTNDEGYCIKKDSPTEDSKVVNNFSCGNSERKES